MEFVFIIIAVVVIFFIIAFLNEPKNNLNKNYSIKDEAGKPLSKETLKNINENREYSYSRIKNTFFDLPIHNENYESDFDEEDELIAPAIERLKSLWESPQTLLADEMEEELHRWRKYLKDTPLIAGMDGNMKDRLAFIDKVEKISAAAANIRKIADDEISPKMKGGNELGEY